MEPTSFSNRSKKVPACFWETGIFCWKTNRSRVNNWHWSKCEQGLRVLPAVSSLHLQNQFINGSLIVQVSFNRLCLLVQPKINFKLGCSTSVGCRPIRGQDQCIADIFQWCHWVNRVQSTGWETHVQTYDACYDSNGQERICINRVHSLNFNPFRGLQGCGETGFSLSI